MPLTLRISMRTLVAMLLLAGLATAQSVVPPFNVDYQIGQDPSLAVSGAVEVSDIDSKIRFRNVLLLCCWTLVK